MWFSFWAHLYKFCDISSKDEAWRLHSMFKYVNVLCYKSAWDDFGFDDLLFISYSVRSFYVISAANQKEVINLLR